MKKVTVAMELEQATREVCEEGFDRRDQVGWFLLGDKYIEIAFGSENAGNLTNNRHHREPGAYRHFNLIAKTDKISIRQLCRRQRQGSDRQSRRDQREINQGKGTRARW